MENQDDIIAWLAAHRELQLAKNDVHVWKTSLDVSSSALAELAATLSPAEKKRAQAFKFDLHRNRFMAGRGLLRTLLSCYLKTGSSELRFVYSPEGKPSLCPTFHECSLHFNLAHTEDLIVFAVTNICPVGVDVEYIRPMDDMHRLVAILGSQSELESFQTLPPEERPVAFFNLWTRKEAFLKATGEGITRSLKLIEVSFRPSEPAQILAIPGDSASCAEWSLQALSHRGGVTGAVAIKATRVRMKNCW